MGEHMVRWLRVESPSKSSEPTVGVLRIEQILSYLGALTALCNQIIDPFNIIVFLSSLVIDAGLYTIARKQSEGGKDRRVS